MEAARSSDTLGYFFLFFVFGFHQTLTLQDLKDLPTPNNKNFILVCAQKVSFVLFFIEKPVSNFVSDGVIFQYGFFLRCSNSSTNRNRHSEPERKLPCTLYVWCGWESLRRQTVYSPRETLYFELLTCDDKIGQLWSKVNPTSWLAQIKFWFRKKGFYSVNNYGRRQKKDMIQDKKK